MEYKIEKFVLGLYMANCYLIWNDNHVLIVDPGSKSKKLMQYLFDKEAIVDGILLTHGHFDHIAGVDAFAKEFHCPIYIDKEDEELLRNPKLNCSLSNHPTIIQSKVKHYALNENRVGDFVFEAMFAPGHTHGCTLLKFDQHLFTGDVLFKQSIGRTDLPGGNNSEMINTLQMIQTLDPDLLIYPGHGDTTNLKEEFLYNSYF